MLEEVSAQELLLQAKERAAISVVVSEVMGKFLELYYKRTDTEPQASTTPKQLEKISKLKCFYGCLLGILSLIGELDFHNADNKRVDSLFIHIFVIKNFASRIAPWKYVSGEALDTQNWSYHSALILQGESGVWYAFSPANFIAHPSEDSDYSKLLFDGQTLDEVLSKLQENEGGSWPIGKLDTLLAKNDVFDYSSPKLYKGSYRNELSYYLVENTPDSVFGPNGTLANQEIDYLITMASLLPTAGGDFV